MSGEIQSVVPGRADFDGILKIERSLDTISAAARLLGHMCASVEGGQEIGEKELSSLQTMLRTAHADIDLVWNVALGEARAAAGKHEEAMTALRAELEAEKKKRAVPGSAEDIRHAQWIWRFLRQAAVVTIEECDEFDPSGAPPVKKPVRRRAKR